MKQKVYKAICYVLIVSFLSPQFSCSVIGLTAGAIIDNNKTKGSSNEVVVNQSWIQPEKEGRKLELKLTNDIIIPGKYRRLEISEEEPNIVELVRVEDVDQMYRIPLRDISSTRIFPEKRNSAKKGFLVGLTIDVAIVALIAASGGPNLNIGLAYCN